jgi:D-alanyl-D-alanine carboxypeptidase
MAGYVLDRSGRRMVVVMIVNHANAHQAQPAMDAEVKRRVDALWKDLKL